MGMNHKQLLDDVLVISRIIKVMQDRGYQLKPKAAAFENVLYIFSQSKKR